MTQQLTLADLELPPGTLDGFSPEQIADVVQAATDGAHARIGLILGGEGPRLVRSTVGAWRDAAEYEGVMDDARIQLEVSR